nr:1,3-beta-glucan synthase subunit FKS1-like, domain-1 [Tanacetum cinerariifolium]
MSEEYIKKQKSLEELAKAEVVSTERRKGKKIMIKALGQDVCENFNKQKVMYDKYYLRNDDSNKVIYKLKVSDLHVSEWKEVLDAYPDRTRASWEIIYNQIRERIDDFNSMGDQLELDLTRPLEEQDPIIRPKQLAKRKRKKLHELQDYFKIRIKDRAHKPPFMHQTIREALWAIWESPEFIAKSDRGRAARQSNKSLHVGGSVSIAEHKRRLQKKLGRHPTAIENFYRTHMKKEKTFVDNEAKETWQQCMEKYGAEDSLDK